MEDKSKAHACTFCPAYACLADRLSDEDNNSLCDFSKERHRKKTPQGREAHAGGTWSLARRMLAFRPRNRSGQPTHYSFGANYVEVEPEAWIFTRFFRQAMKFQAAAPCVLTGRRSKAGED